MTSSSSWVKTITSPFRKACHTIFHNQHQQPSSSSRDHNKKSHRRQTPGGGGVGVGGYGDIGTGHHHHHEEVMNRMDHHHLGLQGEVMACGYEDVQVMWSILDKPNHLIR